MADPGFPVGGGGRAPVRRGVDLRRWHFTVKMYVKTKELGPIGGACAGHAPPRSANGKITQDFKVFLRVHIESIVEPYSPLQVVIRHSRTMIKDHKM